MVYVQSILPFLTLIPLIGAGLIVISPPLGNLNSRAIAIASTFLTLALSLLLFFAFDSSLNEYQFRIRLPWIPSLGISYHVALDGIGVAMVLLHAILSFSGALVSRSIGQNVRLYFIFYLILVASIFGVFTSLDLFLLYLFYEMAVIPLYPLIGIWGSQNREYAAMKLTLYISLGAVVALVGLLALYIASGLNTFDLIELAQSLKSKPFSGYFQMWCAPLLIFGFGVVASLWPFHSWSPIGYAAAPTAVSMLHAGVLKKMGIFITIRLVITLLPEGAAFWLPIVSVLCVVNILYGAWAAMAQKDMKFVIGFSSVSHMGYAFLGLACLNQTGLTGTVFFMFAHGVMAALCFALIGFIYDQTHTRMIADLGGLAKQLPYISICFVMAAFASSGLPGFANFISEILIFFSAWSQYPWQTVLAIFGIVVTATYMLRMVRDVFYGSLKPEWAKLKDANGFGQKLPFGLLVLVLLIFGFWPSLLLDVIRPSTEALIQQYVIPAQAGIQSLPPLWGKVRMGVRPPTFILPHKGGGNKIMRG
ncbi:MAG: NADH-quinone oxidoreductase subunit M [Candidatus Omnitrophica bacterium]|nr:NADH-quinone oxidoreductase subunit M [Candidatus Omnitrophota bacterium]